MVKHQKVSKYYENDCRFQILTLINNFDFLKQISQTRILSNKSRKTEHHHWILHIRISLGTNNLEFWNQICPKQVFRVKNKNHKSEHHYWILHIRISLSTKFHYAQTILNFGTKFAQKQYFRLKTKKVNITIEFYIFELVCVKQFWILGPNLLKKSIFGQNKKNWPSLLNSAYSN